MQGKTEERQSTHAGQRRRHLCLRGHAAAERFAASDQSQPRTASRGFRHRGTHCRLCHRRRVGPPAAILHIGELIAQRRHATFAKAARNIPLIDVLPEQGANVYDILRRDILVLTKNAVEQLQERLK